MKQVSLEVDSRSQLERESLRTVMTFFAIGAFISITFNLVIAAAQDILAGTFIQTSVVHIANIGSHFLISLIGPYFMQKIPYFFRIAAFCLSVLSGIVILALSKQVNWMLAGVGVASFGVGVGDITTIALTSFYGDVTLSAFAAGTGVGLAITPLYYTSKY